MSRLTPPHRHQQEQFPPEHAHTQSGAANPYALNFWSFAAFTVVVALAVFLMERQAMEPYAAILHAVGALAATVFVILVPYRIVELFRQLKLLSQVAALNTTPGHPGAAGDHYKPS